MVVAELGRCNVYAVTSAERGKIHTVLACVLASGYSLPPCKKSVPGNFKEGAVPNRLFLNSESGWMNAELYLQRFEYFLCNIPLLDQFCSSRTAMVHMCLLIL